MPNEPSLPTDLLATIAGLGQGLVQRLPNTQLFEPNPKVILPQE